MLRFRRASGLLVLIAAVGASWVLPASASAAANSVDKTWMAAAHQSNLAEIAAGKSAQANASSSDVKDLGTMLVADHTKLDGSLTSAADKLGVSLPSSPTPAQKKALAAAEAQSGTAYDSAWTTSQLAGHRATLAATQKEISDGSDATVLKLARTATPVVQHHIMELEDLAGTAGSVAAGTGGQAASPSSLPMGLAGVGIALIVAAGAVTVLRRRERAHA